MNTKNYVETNSDFLIKTNYIYPPKNTQIFEEYFLNRFLLENPKTNRIYLPIQWTSYYHSKKINLNGLQNFLYDLPKNEKYFTIVQWDDNIMNDVNHLDLKIFAQGGNGLYKDKSYAIPLNCVFTSVNSLKKDIFASFRSVICPLMFAIPEYSFFMRVSFCKSIVTKLKICKDPFLVEEILSEHNNEIELFFWTDF
jgi:hypothetical protein